MANLVLGTTADQVVGWILFKNICGWIQRALFPARVSRHGHACSCWTWFPRPTKLFLSTLDPTAFSKTLTYLSITYFPEFEWASAWPLFLATRFNALSFLGHCQNKTSFFQVKCLGREWVGKGMHSYTSGGAEQARFLAHSVPGILPYLLHTHTSPLLLGWHFPSTFPSLRLVIPKPRADKPQKIIGIEPVISYYKDCTQKTTWASRICVLCLPRLSSTTSTLASVSEQKNWTLAQANEATSL